MKIKSEILQKEFDFSVNHIGLTFDENFWLKDEYVITINGQRYNYFQGIGHRKEKSKYHKKDAQKWLNFRPRKEIESFDYLVKMLNTNTIPKEIKIDDVLYSLVLDSDYGQMSFNDFCDNFGYNYDSIKHLNLHRECTETYKKVQKIGININKAIELFQDY